MIKINRDVTWFLYCKIGTKNEEIIAEYNIEQLFCKPKLDF